MFFACFHSGCCEHAFVSGSARKRPPRWRRLRGLGVVAAPAASTRRTSRGRRGYAGSTAAAGAAGRSGAAAQRRLIGVGSPCRVRRERHAVVQPGPRRAECCRRARADGPSRAPVVLVRENEGRHPRPPARRPRPPPRRASIHGVTVCPPVPRPPQGYRSSRSWGCLHWPWACCRRARPCDRGALGAAAAAPAHLAGLPRGCSPPTNAAARRGRAQSSYLWGYALGQLPAGMLSDRCGDAPSLFRAARHVHSRMLPPSPPPPSARAPSLACAPRPRG